MNTIVMQSIEINFGEYQISTDKAKMDVDAIHDFLSNHSDWSRNIPKELVQRSVEHSLNVGLFHQAKQIGYARIISDYSTIAYLGDVYVLEGYRGLGLSNKLMEVVMGHPQLQGLRRWILLTSTADWLYEKFGFTRPARPDLYWEKHQKGIYG